jgi:hypothetical protein
MRDGSEADRSPPDDRAQDSGGAVSKWIEPPGAWPQSIDVPDINATPHQFKGGPIIWLPNDWEDWQDGQRLTVRIIGRGIELEAGE